MKHQKVQAKLLLFLEGELPRAEHVALQTHLDSCPACRELLETFQQAWQTYETEKMPASDTWAQINSRLTAKEPRLVSFDFLYLRSVVYALLLILAVAVGYYQGSLLLNTANLNGGAETALAKTFWLDTLEPVSQESQIFMLAALDYEE